MPFVTGAGAATRIGSKIDDIGDAARLANRLDDAVDAGRTIDRTADAARLTNRLDDAARGINQADNAGDAARLANKTDNVSSARYADDAVGTICSFSGDTLVATVNGLEMISRLEEGDTVLAYDEATGTIGTYPILATWVHDDPVIVMLTIDGETIETTPEHPFYTEEGDWVAAGALQAGDRIRQADGTTGTVEAVELVYRLQPMYNLTVATAHTFFVGDGQWLVHNTCRYPKAEWDARIKITENHPIYKCWQCAWEMNFRFGDEVTIIRTEKVGKPLYGPNGKDIGAPAGWHAVSVDRYQNAWDNWGFQGSAREYIDAILKENPGAVAKTFTDIRLASHYHAPWLSAK